MIIRKATNDETNMILDLSKRFIEESTMGYLTFSEENVLKTFEPFLANGAYYLVAKNDDVLLGWLLVGWNIDQFTHETIGFLLDIYIFPEYRRSGVANKLVTEALKILKEDNYRKVQLTIFSGNPSKILCEQFGFKEVLTLFEKTL